MGRLKKGSRALERADQRLASVKSINHKLDFGSGFSVAAYEAKVASTRQRLEAYNMMLSKADAAANAFKAAEKELATMSESMLLGVAMKYGKASSEYEMAGGKRRGEKRRASVEKAAVAETVEPQAANSAPVAMNASPEMVTA